MKQILKKIRHPIRAYMNYHIQKYHGSEWIHRREMADVINEEVRIDAIRQKKFWTNRIHELEKRLERKYDIKESGHKATIIRLEEIDEKREKWFEKVMEFYYKIMAWEKDIQMTISKNKLLGNKAGEHLGTFKGALDEMDFSIVKIDKEINGADTQKLIDNIVEG